MKQAVLLLVFPFFCQQILAQSVGVGTTSPNANAALHIVAPSNNQGVLIPSMNTEQRTDEQFTANLSAPDNGLLVFDLTENRFYYWSEADWIPVWSGDVNRVLAAGDGVAIDSQNQIVNTGDTDSTDDITINTTAGGVLQGMYPNPELAEEVVQTVNLADLMVVGSKVANNTLGVEKLSGLADPTSGRNSVMITSNSNAPRWFQPSANQVLVTDNTGQITSRSAETFVREDLALGEIYIGNNDGEAEPVDVSDIGNILVGNGTTLFKLDASGNGRLLVGNGTTLVSVDVMGDISLDGTGTTQIIADAVGTAEIADGSVASADLAIQAVTTDKIALNAVQSSQILDGTIILDDLADGSVNAAKIADGAITNGDINSGAAITVSKLEALNTGQIIFGNAGVPTIGTLTGDASINAFGNLTLNSLATIDVNGGTIDNTAIGSTTPSTGNFTSVTATDGSGIAALNADNLTAGTIPDARLSLVGANGSFGGGTDVIQSMTVDAQGRVTAVAAGPSPSDLRLKENITELAYSPQKIYQLQAYNYQWKDAEMGAGNQIGLIAQEVEKIYPELVKERSDGYKGVVYQGLIPVLIEATKDQQSTLDSLNQQNASLQNQVTQLEKNLEQYKEQLNRLESAIQKITPGKSPTVTNPEAQ
ncbi:MAG: tail fiber domain-containing protein [Tunicatimonas sp.]|uniref:tail fiber domain-containing protein n=1 Tax=Tunicatimonas sp. TaxID=1940096 RepID=UPI003C70F79F